MGKFSTSLDNYNADSKGVPSRSHSPRSEERNSHLSSNCTQRASPSPFPLHQHIQNPHWAAFLRHNEADS